MIQTLMWQSKIIKLIRNIKARIEQSLLVMLLTGYWPENKGRSNKSLKKRKNQLLRIFMIEPIIDSIFTYRSFFSIKDNRNLYQSQLFFSF